MDVIPVRIVYHTPDGKMKPFCKVTVYYGAPIPAGQQVLIVIGQGLDKAKIEAHLAQ